MIAATPTPLAARSAITVSSGVPLSSMVRRRRRDGVSGFIGPPLIPHRKPRARRPPRSGAVPTQDLREITGGGVPWNGTRLATLRPKRQIPVTRQGRILVVDDEVNARTAL